MASKPREPSETTASVKCKNCEQKMLIWRCKLKFNRGKFCSHKCAAAYNKTHLNVAGWNKGLLGKDSHMYGNKHSLGYRHTPETRRKMSAIRKATKNHLWIHGRGRQRTHHADVEYKLWRKAVFERDNYICQGCNIKGGYLEADHIQPVALHPELKLELSNGRTLCRACHIKTDTFGSKTRKLMRLAYER